MRLRQTLTFSTLTFSEVFFRLRSAVFGFAAAGLCYVCLSSVCFAQRTTSPRHNPVVVEAIDAEEGAQRIMAFRALRLDGDFCFKFQLEHKPRRGKTVRYQGVMYGSWNERGPVSRLQLFPEQIKKETQGPQSSIEMIVQNGVAPEVWVRRQSEDTFTLIQEEALFEPVFDGVLFTPFDLQMPFVFWQDYSYEGPTRLRTRDAQCFLMQSPEDSLARQNGISGVRIVLDDTYYALLKADVFRGGSEPVSTFEASVLRKVQDQWIVREVSLKDLQSKDVTTFNVKAARVGLLLDVAVFDPQANAGVPQIAPSLFKVF